MKFRFECNLNLFNRLDLRMVKASVEFELSDRCKNCEYKINAGQICAILLDGQFDAGNGAAGMTC